MSSIVFLLIQHFKDEIYNYVSALLPGLVLAQKTEHLYKCEIVNALRIVYKIYIQIND